MNFFEFSQSTIKILFFTKSIKIEKLLLKRERESTSVGGQAEGEAASLMQG